MDPTIKNCPSCGAPQTAGNAVCTACGSPMPPASPAPGAPAQNAAAGYSMPPPPAAPAAPAWQPPAPAAPAAGNVSGPVAGAPPYGAPPSPYSPVPPAAAAPPPPVQQGYGAPPAGAPGYGAPPAGPSTPPPSGAGVSRGAPLPPPPKKSKAPLIIILCIVGAVLVGGGILLFVLFGGSANKAAQEEYGTLLTSICSASKPEKIAGYRDELDAFAAEHPDLVDADLEALVTACETYRDDDEYEEYRYTDMLDALKTLSRSSIQEIAACADVLTDYVEEDYEDYLYYLDDSSSEPTPSPSSSSPPAPPPSDITSGNVPYSLLEDGLAYIVEDEEGTPYYSFGFTNDANKSIAYFQVMTFCYDADGNPCYGTGDYPGYNLELDGLGAEIELGYMIGPGETLDFEFFWRFYNCADAVYGISFISYIEYEDGSSWGVEAYDYALEGDALLLVQELQEAMDLIGALAPYM